VNKIRFYEFEAALLLSNGNKKRGVVCSDRERRRQFARQATALQKKDAVVVAYYYYLHRVVKYLFCAFYVRITGSTNDSELLLSAPSLLFPSFHAASVSHLFWGGFYSAFFF
jgi:hypothetical protein